MIPAIAPITTASHISTSAQPAVIPTKPARIPLMVMERSGLPSLVQVVKVAVTAPAAAARLVVTAI